MQNPNSIYAEKGSKVQKYFYCFIQTCETFAISFLHFPMFLFRVQCNWKVSESKWGSTQMLSNSLKIESLPFITFIPWKPLFNIDTEFVIAIALSGVVVSIQDYVEQRQFYCTNDSLTTPAPFIYVCIHALLLHVL